MRGDPHPKKERNRMTRDNFIRRAKAILAEAYEEVAEMIALYLDAHPSEQLQTLCKEIDPDNWDALRQRVQRTQKARKASAGAESARTTTVWTERGGAGRRDAKRILRAAEPEQIAELLEDVDVRANLAAARQVHEMRQENRTGIPRRNTPQGPTFISLILKVNGWLDELVGMVERGEAEVPAEFSSQSLTDIGVKAMRLKELVDEARAAEEAVTP